MYGVVPGSLPPVLVPGLDLRVREVEGGRELHAVLHAQVLLSLEAALELGELVVSERRSRLPGFLQPHLRAVLLLEISLSPSSFTGEKKSGEPV